MLEKLDPSLPLKLGGKIRRLKYTLGAIMKFQEMSGIDIISNGLSITELDAAQFRAFIYCGLLHQDGKITFKRAGQWIKKNNAIELIMAATIAIKAAMPEVEDGGNTEEKEAKIETPWLKLWSIGRYELRFSDEEFWALTPAQFYELLKRYHDEEEKQDFRTAIIASNILNLLPRTEKTKNRWFEPGDIFPQYNWGKKNKGKPIEKMTINERLEYFRNLNAMMGGREVIKDG